MTSLGARDLPGVLTALSIVAFPVARRPAELLFVGAILAAAAVGWPGDDRRRAARVVLHGLIMLAAITWVLVRTVPPWGLGLHGLNGESLYPVSRIDYAPFLMGFLLLALHRYEERDVRLVCWAFAATVPVYALLVVLQQHVGWHDILRWRPFGVPVLEVVVGPGRPGRASAGTRGANVLAMAAWFGLVASATLLWAEGVRRQAARPAVRGLLLVLLATAGWLVLQTGSRATWAAAALLVAAAAMRLPRRAKAAVLVMALVVGALVLVSVRDLGGATTAARRVVPEVVWGRIAGAGGYPSSPLAWRTDVWRCGLDLAAQRPLTGVGVGEYGPACEQRRQLEQPDQPVHPGRLNHAHNLPIQVVAELGWPFAVLVFAWIGWLVVEAAVRLRHTVSSADGRLRVGLLALVVGVLAISQLNLAVAHDHRLAIGFWAGLAVVLSPLGTTVPEPPARATASTLPDDGWRVPAP